MILRVIEERDLPRLRDWRNDDLLRPNFREYRLLNLINQQDWLNHVSRSREVEMFGIQDGENLVGVCGLCSINWVNRTAEISIYVAPDKLLGWIGIEVLELLRRKAFEEFNLHRLWTESPEFDTARIALFEKCGYVLEGRLREHVFSLGKYHGSLMYGLLRGETE